MEGIGGCLWFFGDLFVVVVIDVWVVLCVFIVLMLIFGNVVILFGVLILMIFINGWLVLVMVCIVLLFILLLVKGVVLVKCSIWCECCVEVVVVGLVVDFISGLWII